VFSASLVCCMTIDYFFLVGEMLSLLIGNVNVILFALVGYCKNSTIAVATTTLQDYDDETEAISAASWK